MNVWWYVNRSAGLVSWVLLAGSIILGLMLSSKAAGKKVRPNWIQDLHRGLSGLAVAFVGVHILGAVADSYVHFGWADVLVPFASSWNPLAVAWGIVTMYLLVAVEATSLARKHIPKTLWKRIHILSFPLFVTATVHLITAGTDIANTIVIVLVAMLSAAIMGLTVFRVLDAMEAAKNPAPSRVPVRPAPAPPAPAPRDDAEWPRPRTGAF